MGLLKSCCAFEAYCRHYTADCGRYASPSSWCSAPIFRDRSASPPRESGVAEGVAALTGRSNGRAERLAGRLMASLDYGQMDEIIGVLPVYLQGIVAPGATQIDTAIYQQYIAYPIEAS